MYNLSSSDFLINHRCFPSVRSEHHVREREVWWRASVGIFIFLTDTLGCSIKTKKLCSSSHTMNWMQNLPVAFLNHASWGWRQQHMKQRSAVWCVWGNQCVCDCTKQATTCLNTNTTFLEALRKNTETIPLSSEKCPSCWYSPSSLMHLPVSAVSTVSWAPLLFSRLAAR